jgi:hypothetical protein
MAISVVDIATPAGLKKHRDTDITATKAAVDATSGSIHAIVIDNTNNAAEAEYLKLWDAASGDVTVGTTAPDWVFKVPAATKVTIVFQSALAYGTALTAACVTTAGTAGTTNPTSDVIVEILYET